MFLPRRYDDRRTYTAIAELSEGTRSSVRGVVSAAAIRFAGRRIFELAVRDDSGVLSCRFYRFHSKAMEQRYPRGQEVIVSGAVSKYGAQARMFHPEIDLVAPGVEPTPEGLIGIYRDLDGVPEKTLRAILRELARGAALLLEDPLPAELRKRLKLPELGRAVQAAHVPEELDDHEILHRRLVFDELFYLQLALALRKRKLSERSGRAHVTNEDPVVIARGMFPFELTAAQQRALKEIAADLSIRSPMARLIQGDVGSGKTAVALAAAAIVIWGKSQVALLAPTEILAAQHAQLAQRALEKRGAKVALLTGGLKTSVRKPLLAALADGEIDLLVGTHALLEDDVVFRDLGLAIVDEQHRFGVEQRKALRSKQALPPDLLVMTATPIPRTLAMAFYGDLSLTVIDELPPGRTPVVTKIFDPKRRSLAYAHLQTALADGRQAFIVYPLVESSAKSDLSAASDAVFELEHRFKPHEVGLLHGRMRAEEKAEVMRRFVNKEIALLVSTTVIEVGVDVPNATVMIVEHAERFGLSQLHQLRGRVGRGEHAGACFLIADAASKEARARLSVLEKSGDGFLVAEHDLKTRGPGELLGTKQHGLPELELADLTRDAKLLELAQQEAQRLAQSPETIDAAMMKEMSRRFSDRLDLIDAG